jgi:hypothetical protein
MTLPPIFAWAFPITLASIAILFVAGFFYRWRYRLAKSTLQHILPYLRVVEMEEFKYLLNMADEGVLRLNMPPKEFRKEQINRIHEALEHSGRMDHNLWALHEWCNHENRKSWKTRNREVRSLSQEMLESCAQLRIALFAARFKLVLWLYRITFFAFLPIPAIGEIRCIGYCDLVVAYENIKDLAERLSRACGDEHEMLVESL